MHAQLYGGADATNLLAPIYNVTDAFLRQNQLHASHDSHSHQLHPSSNQRHNLHLQPEFMVAPQSPPSHFPYYQQPEVRRPLSFSRLHIQAAGAASAAQRPVVTSASDFLNNSVSDVSLKDFEEHLARAYVSDTYFGPPRPCKTSSQGRNSPGATNDAQNTTEEKDEAVEVEELHHHMPNSTTSLALVPPGVQFISEIWNVFAKQTISQCNSTISGMAYEGLQRCLHAHGLNQLGSTYILGRRLLEFVLRLPESAARAPSKHLRAVPSFERNARRQQRL